MNFAIKAGLLVLLVTLVQVCKAEAQDAQTLKQLSAYTLKRSVQCELGRFARSMRAVPGNRMTTKVVLTREVRHSDGWGFDIRALFIALGGGAGSERQRIVQQTVTFTDLNIHRDNFRACRDGNIIELTDLRECLQDGAATYATGDLNCVAQVNVKGSSNLNAGIPVYVVTVGPNFSWSDLFVRGVQVIAPKPR